MAYLSSRSFSSRPVPKLGREQIKGLYEAFASAGGHTGDEFFVSIPSP